MNQAVIVSAARTAVGKAPNGALRSTRPDDMAAAVIGAVLDRAPGFDRSRVEDVIFGCAMPEAEQGLNAVDRIRGRAGDGRVCRGDRGRWNRVDEPGADGWTQTVAEPRVGGKLS